MKINELENSDFICSVHTAATWKFCIDFSTPLCRVKRAMTMSMETRESTCQVIRFRIRSGRLEGGAGLAINYRVEDSTSFCRPPMMIIIAFRTEAGGCEI